jgi:phage baseplate assembly protein W
MAQAEIPHFAFPFGRGADGRINTVEQDTPEHVNACENVIVACSTGAREERPEFGWPIPQFATMPIDPAPLERALERFEPRGNHTVTEHADAIAQAIEKFSIRTEA